MAKDASSFDLGDVLVTEQIGRTRYRTPEGYLYCENVRIASTKPLLYRADEMRNVRAQHGMVLMDRPPEVLFSADTLASFQGKDVTDSHPTNLVGPKTWKRTSVGVVLNPRQGMGTDNGYLVADLLIKHDGAIKAVEDGKCEVSCGYDQEHEEVKPGLGRFTRITGNHVALVDKGRCGPACAIGDEDEQEGITMTKRSIFDRLRTAFQAGDESAFDAELAEFRKAADDHSNAQRVIIEVNDGATVNDGKDGDKGKEKTVDEKIADAFAPLKTTLDAILAKMDGKTAEDNCSEEEKKKKMEDEKAAKDAADKAAADAAAAAKAAADKEAADKKAATDADTLDATTLGALRVAYQGVVSKAEILMPGLKVPAFDGLANSKKTIADSMCGLRKAALDGALKDSKRKAFVEPVLGVGMDTEKLSCDAMEVVFNAATELARMANNAPRVSFDHANFQQGPMTAARLQEINVAARQNKTA